MNQEFLENATLRKAVCTMYQSTRELFPTKDSLGICEIIAKDYGYPVSWVADCCREFIIAEYGSFINQFLASPLPPERPTSPPPAPKRSRSVSRRTRRDTSARKRLTFDEESTPDNEHDQAQHEVPICGEGHRTHDGGDASQETQNQTD